jgi:hypothetical protein
MNCIERDSKSRGKNLTGFLRHLICRVACIDADSRLAWFSKNLSGLGFGRRAII